MGTMIPIPFIFWLLFTIFDFGNSDQIFAVLGIIGLFMQLVKPDLKTSKKEIIFYILSFLLLITPILKRMLSISIENFNYLAFTIPMICFVILYFVSVIIKIKALKKPA